MCVLPCSSLRPSCPALFFPQPNTAPDSDRAKLWSPPALIWASGIPLRDLSGWGDRVLGSPFPKPSWPLEFSPHTNSWPSETRRTAGRPRLPAQQKTKLLGNQWKYLPFERAMQCWLPHMTCEIRCSYNLLINLKRCINKVLDYI